MDFLNELMVKYPMINLVLVVLGSLMVVAQTVVVFTPTKKDDEILEKIEGNAFFKKLWDFVVSFAPIQKKK